MKHRLCNLYLFTCAFSSLQKMTKKGALTHMLPANTRVRLSLTMKDTLWDRNWEAKD